MDKQSNETFSEIINAFFIDMEFDGMIQWGLLFYMDCTCHIVRK